MKWKIKYLRWNNIHKDENIIWYYTICKIYLYKSKIKYQWIQDTFRLFLVKENKNLTENEGEIKINNIYMKKKEVNVLKEENEKKNKDMSISCFLFKYYINIFIFVLFVII